MLFLNHDFSSGRQLCVAAAVVGGAVVGAGASIYSGNKAAGAAEKGAQKSADAQRYMYDTSRADLAPWRTVGEGALKQLASLYGINSSTAANAGAQTADNFDSAAYMKAHPEVADPNQWDPNAHSAYDHYTMYGQKQGFDFPYLNPPSNGTASNQPDYSAFENSPDYQFTYGQGLKATQAGLAARGLSGSGRAMKALTQYGQGAASTQLNNYRNSLASLAGVGQTATTNTAQLGSTAASNIGASYQNAADARASGYLNTGNQINNLINQGTGTYALSKLYQGAAA